MAAGDIRAACGPSREDDGAGAAADPVFRLTGGGMLLEASRSARALTGARPGVPLADLILPDDRGALARALLTQGASDVRFLRRPDRWWWLRPPSAPAADGTLTVRATDVTDRRAAEADTARQAVDRVLNALDEINDAFVIYDRDGHMVVCNRRFRDLYGYSEAEARPGVHFRDLGRLDVERGNVMVGDGEGTEGYLARKAEYRRRLTGVFDVQLRDGRWIQTRDRRLPDGGFVSIQTDVTESRRAAAELVAARDDAERALADTRAARDQLEQFAYVASHDLREPLRMITSYLDLLERRDGAALSADGQQFVGHARNGARRMDALILDLLAYTRVGRSDIGTDVVDMDGVVRAVRANLSLALAESGGTLDVPPSLPAVVGCEPELVSLLQNLIGNAIKYRQPAHPPRIRLTVERASGDRARFAIHDNGIGIEACHHERIFRIFQRLHRRDAYPGSGIGLALCRKIVEHHGGTLTIESEPGRGSVLGFDLRIAP